MSDTKPIRAILSWELNGSQELVLREGDSAQLGREDGNDVVLAVPYVSRRHSVITWRDDGFEIQDLGSTNGTQVNGKKITEPQKLKDNDRIHLERLEMTFRLTRNSDEKVGRAQTMVVEASIAQPNLVISSGAEEGRKIILRRGVMTIGRATAHSEHWDIALQDRAVSRPHAQVEYAGDKVMLNDLGSANGTLRNGQHLAEAGQLQDGDVIVIGETTLIFRMR